MNPYLEEAMRQHQHGQLQEAEASYRQILARSPGDADALHFLGVLLHQQGNSLEGARLIRKAIKRSSACVDAHKNLGKVMSESGNLPKAEQSFREALKLRPDDADTYHSLCIVLRKQDLYAESISAGEQSVSINAGNPLAWLSYGSALMAGGMLDEAVTAIYQALSLDRQLVPAHFELHRALYRLEKISDAPEEVRAARIKAYQAWLSVEPDNSRAAFMLAACTGDSTVSRAPDNYVKELFDEFSKSFDSNLAELQYQVPRLFKECIQRLIPEPTGDLTVLDAGCGTGLCAAFLRPVAKTLIGVDLSPGMLNQARKLDLFDELCEAELLTYLRQKRHRYDLIICGDTLIYFGELLPFFKAAEAALGAGGRLFVSVEQLADDAARAYQLNTSGRYSHSEAYVRQRLADVGLELIKMDRVVLRMESAQPVYGLIVSAGKAA